MRQDMNYDNGLAIDDFSYSPRPFLTNPERDLPIN